MNSSSADQKKFIAIGQVLRPHGIRGALKIKLFNPDSGITQSFSQESPKKPQDLYSLIPPIPKKVIQKDVLLDEDLRSLIDQWKSLSIQSLQILSSPKGSSAFAQLKSAEIQGRNEAEELREARLYIERSQLADPKAGEIYLVDLIGWELEEKGQSRGRVSGFYENGAQSIMICELFQEAPSTAEKTDQKKEILEIPFIKDVTLKLHPEKEKIEALIPPIKPFDKSEDS